MMAARNGKKNETKREEERREKAKKERRRRAITTDRPVPTLHSFNISLWGKTLSKKKCAQHTLRESAISLDGGAAAGCWCARLVNISDEKQGCSKSTEGKGSGRERQETDRRSKSIHLSGSGLRRSGGARVPQVLLPRLNELGSSAGLATDIESPTNGTHTHTTVLC